jgi:polysaccharide chain length determinant protein (PEP-CTERM system associated)
MLPGKQYTPAEYIGMALRWKWVIIVPLLVGGYAGLVVSSRQPEIYQSDMLIQVIPQRIPPSFVQTTVTMRTIDRLTALTEQILSRTELEGLITELDLYPEERARLPMQDVVEQMRVRHITIEPVVDPRTRDADSFHVRFRYRNAATAKRVTERLGSLFIDVNSRDRNAQAIQTQKFLASQLEESKKDLEATEERMRVFRERNAGRLPTQLAVNMQAMQNAQTRAQSLAESIARARGDRITRERLLEEAEDEIIFPVVPVASTTQPVANPAAQAAGTTAQQLVQARQALMALELRFKPDFPDVITAKAAIAKLEAQLEVETKAAEDARRAAEANKNVELPAVGLDPREVARRARVKQLHSDIENFDRDIARMQEEEQKMRTLIDGLQLRMDQVPGVESEWVALTRDYDTKSASYRTLLAKSETAELASSLEEAQIGEQFRVLDPARVPGRPLGVNRLAINAVGAAAGLGFGLLLAGLLEFRDRTFRGADDIVDVLKLPVVALVPQIVSDADQTRARLKMLAAAAVGIVVAAAGVYGAWAMRLWKYVV